MRKSLAERYIQPESVSIGDTVRMYTVVGDMQISNIGVVARREHVGRATEYYTAQGNLLGVNWRDGVTKLRVTLLKPAPQNAPIPLEGIEL